MPSRPPTDSTPAPPNLPIQVNAKGRVNWLAFSPNDGRVSPCYWLSTKNREVYVGQRGMPGIKISLHKTGDAHLSAKDHETAQAWKFPSRSKRPTEWSTRFQFHPGWSRLLHVVHPEPELRPFSESGLESVKGLIRLPVPPEMALHVCLLRYTGAPVNTRIEFENAVHVATIEDGEDWRLEVMAVLEAWSHEHRDWAQSARLVPPGSHGRSATAPCFNQDSISARLTKLVTMEDGSKRLYDLAANEPD
jgi:hypothetical protein